MLAQPKTLFAYLLGKCHINFYIELVLMEKNYYSLNGIVNNDIRI